MSNKANKNEPGALDEFLQRQEHNAYPTNGVGSFRPNNTTYVLGRYPLLRLLLGIFFGVPAIIGLITDIMEMISTFHFSPDIWYNLYSLIIPTLFLVLSVLFIISGIRNLRSKGGKRTSRQQ